MRLVWSQVVFTLTNAISLPIYLLIMIICIKEWKRNHGQRTFFLLMISQGIVDIVVMANYFIFNTLRVSLILDNSIWYYQKFYVAEWCFNQTYISVFIRMFRCPTYLIPTVHFSVQKQLVH
ncbi:hypothetical protein COOONC_18650 [Cooperia oncophora]